MLVRTVSGYSSVYIHALFSLQVETCTRTLKIPSGYDSKDTQDRLDWLNSKINFKYSSNLQNEPEDLKGIIKDVIKYFDTNIPTMFKKEKDRNIAYSIVDLFRHKDDIENFNKKSLYILIREMTDVDTAHITSVVNVLKKHYKKLLNLYHKTGTIIVDNSGSFF